MSGSFSRFSIDLLASTRAWNIAVRAAHIAAMGVLLGGHAFNVSRPLLLPGLWLTIGTGTALAALEAGPRLVWFHQLRGLMTLAKLCLLGVVPLFWDYRLPILLVVVVIASVGSHMTARLRYYSVIYNKVICYRGGPGTAQLAAELQEQEDGIQDE